MVKQFKFQTRKHSVRSQLFSKCGMFSFLEVAALKLIAVLGVIVTIKCCVPPELFWESFGPALL